MYDVDLKAHVYCFKRKYLIRLTFTHSKNVHIISASQESTNGTTGISVIFTDDLTDNQITPSDTLPRSYGNDYKIP